MIRIDSKSKIATRYRPVTRANVSRMPQWRRLEPGLQEAVMVVSRVLPFRTNAYVMEELIDWNRVPEDPMFQLTFPQRGMLSEEDYRTMARLVRAGAPADQIEAEANRIRQRLNPHPAGQKTHNVPRLHGRPLPGVQHKYRETVLFFPSHGQTCHAYCTFCFRWAQFVGGQDSRFAAREAGDLAAYIRQRPDVTDVLLTGGDPMVMKSGVLRQYVEPLLRLDQIGTIRIGTKAVAYWPHRFVTDDDADDVLRLFEQIVASGRHLALMGHYCHPVELSTGIARQAAGRIRATGANIRMQSPLIRHVNNHPDIWADLWRDGVRLGCIPYYMFVQRDTGAQGYFEIPLARCWEIFRGAYRQVSGMARTVRGPSMSAFPGKVHILGVTQIGPRRAFMLEYLQARQPELVRRPFFARFDPQATWYDQLRPFSEQDRPFFPPIPAEGRAGATVLTVRKGLTERETARPG
jgi:L-lysine 2,3-aminomutase